MATDIRQAFFRAYSRLRQWHGTSHKQAEAGVTEVRTRTGRRRLVPEKASKWERFTALVNTPVQGGTADGMKHALILIQDRLPKSARIVSTVHDEVVVKCREESADECRAIITSAMVEAMANLGRIATDKDLEPDDSDKGIDNHIPFVNRLSVWWKRMKANRFLDTATDEQREALKRDLEPIVTIYNQL